MLFELTVLTVGLTILVLATAVTVVYSHGNTYTLPSMPTIQLNWDWLFHASENAKVGVEELLQGATQGKVGDFADQRDKAGGAAQAAADFEDICVPGSIVERGSGVKTGRLPDGRTVTLYPSSKGPMTIQIPDKNDPTQSIKTRYP